MGTLLKDDPMFLRGFVFSPYRRGMGPKFRLRMWDTGRRDGRGCNYVRYQLSEVGGEVIFAGEDFAGSPLHAIDSDECAANLMGFLTLRPGDTDSEYFENYTEEQLTFCQAHGEALSAEVAHRLGEY